MALGRDDAELYEEGRQHRAPATGKDRRRRGAQGGESEEPIRGFEASRWRASSLAVADKAEGLSRARRGAQADPSRLRSLLGGGEPLPDTARQSLEMDLGYDLSGVRVHADDRAATAASRLGAKAFTVGPAIAFNRGRFQPDSAAGSRLLRHEVSHVIQQAGGSSSLGLSQPSGARASGLGPAAQEQEADALASRRRGSGWWQGAARGLETLPGAAASASQPRLMPLPGVRDLAVQLEPEEGADGAEAPAQAPHFEYTAKEGDTLHGLAERFLGGADRLEELLALNPDITDPDHIEAGQVIKIPKGERGEQGKRGDRRDGQGEGEPEKKADADGEKVAAPPGPAGEASERKEDKAEGDGQRADAPQDQGPRLAPPGPDVAPPAPVNLPQVETKANDQVKGWLRTHPDPSRGPRVEALGTVTDRIFASSQTLKMNMPSRATGWHGVDEKIGNFLKDFKDVPFKGKNLGTLQKILNVLHQVSVGIDKASSIVGTIGTVATVGGAILTLLAPPVGVFLLAAGRLANVISLTLAAAKVILNAVKVGLNMVQIAKEKDPEKLAELVGVMQTNIESGLMAGLDVVLAKTGGGAAGKAGKGLAKGFSLKGLKAGLKSGGLKGAMAQGSAQLKAGLKGGLDKGLKGLKNNFSELKKGLKPGTMMNRLKKGVDGGIRNTFVKPFADLRHSTKDLGIAFKSMKQNANLNNFFKRDYWRKVYATNFPTLKAAAEAKAQQKARDVAVKDIRAKLKTGVDPAEQAELFKKLKGLGNDKVTQTLARQSKVGALISDLKDTSKGGFASHVTEGLYGRTEYDARSKGEILQGRQRAVRNEARSAAKAEMKEEGLSWKEDLEELRKRTGDKVAQHYQDAHGKKVLKARQLALTESPDVHSSTFENRFRREMERQYEKEGKISRIQRNIHFRGAPGEAHREADGHHNFNRLQDRTGLERLAAVGKRDFKTAMESQDDLTKALKATPGLLGLKTEGAKEKEHKAKGMKTAGDDGVKAMVAAEMKQWVSGVQQAAQQQTALSAEHALEGLLMQAVHAITAEAGPAPRAPAAPGVASGGEQAQDAGPPLPAFGPGTFEQLEALDGQLATLAEIEADTKGNLEQSQRDKADFLKDKAGVTKTKLVAEGALNSAKAKEGEAAKAGQDVEKGMAASQKGAQGMNKLQGDVNAKAGDAGKMAQKPVDVKAKETPKPPPKKEEGGFFSSVWGGIKKAANWVADQAMKAVRFALNKVTSAINKVKAYFTGLVTDMVMSIVKRIVGEEQASRIDQALLLNKRKKLAAAQAQLKETQTQAQAAKQKAAVAETALDRRIAQADSNIKDAQGILGEVQAQRAAVTAEKGALKGALDAFVATHGPRLAAGPGPAPGPAPQAGPDAGEAAPPAPTVPGQTLAHLGRAADLVDKESAASVEVVDKEANVASANLIGSLNRLPARDSAEYRQRASRIASAAKGDHKASQARRRAAVASIRGRIAGLAGGPPGTEVVKISADLKAQLGGAQADRNAALHGLFEAFTDLAGDVKNLSTDVGDGLHGDEAKAALRAPEQPPAT